MKGRAPNQRRETIAVAGVEAEIIRVHGEWPERYRALVFESSDGMPDHTTTWDRVSGQMKSGSWLSGRGALTLEGARKKARRLLSDYIAKNPETAALIRERYEERIAREKEQAELAAVVLVEMAEPGPLSRPSGLT